MIIGFVGAFGDSNFGDYAMLVNDIYEINNKDNIVFTYNSSLLQLLNEKYFNEYNICECIVKSRYHYNETVSGKYHVEYHETSIITNEIFEEVSNLLEIQTQIEKVDKLIVVGGGYFNHLWNAKHRRAKLLSIIVPILVANKLNKEIIFMGNSYGPFDESREFFSSFFNMLKMPILASRDNVFSIANLREIGITSEIKLIPDDLYFLSTKLADLSKDISIKEREYIVLELFMSMDEVRKEFDGIRQFVISMKRNYHIDTLLLPLDKKYGGEFQCQFLKDSIPSLSLIEFDENAYQSIEKVNAIVKNAAFVICQRYHLFVFAVANNIPVKHVLKDVCGDKRYYFSKSKGVLNQAFLNQTYNDELFIANHFKDVLNNIIDNFYDIIYEENSLYNDGKTIVERAMFTTRKSYIKENVLNEVDS